MMITFQYNIFIEKANESMRAIITSVIFWQAYFHMKGREARAKITCNKNNK